MQFSVTEMSKLYDCIILYFMLESGNKLKYWYLIFLRIIKLYLLPFVFFNYLFQTGVELTNKAVFDVFDPDKGDLHHYKITGGANHSLFGINSITGQLHFAVNYTLSTMPRQIIIDVTVFDIAGLNDTTNVEIIVQPINHVPRIINLPMTVYVREGLAPGSRVYLIDVFDEDSTDLKIFKVRFDPPQGAALFTFDGKSEYLILTCNLSW